MGSDADGACSFYADLDILYSTVHHAEQFAGLCAPTGE